MIDTYDVVHAQMILSDSLQGPWISHRIWLHSMTQIVFILLTRCLLQLLVKF